MFYIACVKSFRTPVPFQKCAYDVVCSIIFLSPVHSL